METSEFDANSVDPDQIPNCAASDRVCTVCKCPFYWTLNKNELIPIHLQWTIPPNKTKWFIIYSKECYREDVMIL